jgi:hypothetical protein
MGGLGNQMFQYAFGKAMSGTDVRYNLSWYQKSKNVHRPFRLDKFKTNIRVHESVKQTIYEKHEQQCDLTLLKKDGFNFVGYWQYLPYIISVISTLKKEFVVKEEFYNENFLALREKIVNCESVSLHVRRGDYVWQKGFHDLPFHYYVRALCLVPGELFVFSDDIAWCRDKFKESYFQRNITFVQLDDYLDFELMRSCTHNVCANSTFSFWAALMNNNPSKMVVTPFKWLGDNVIGDEKRFPKEWIKISDYVI